MKAAAKPSDGSIPGNSYGRDAFLAQLARYAEMTDEGLDAILAVPDVPERQLFDAMRYSVSAGGKRIRPALLLAVGDMFGGARLRMLPFACALELIHTYSLIHDDLPAMDNDDYRRGRPTNHKVYGEAMAILAGDGLLNLSYELMLGTAAEAEGDGPGMMARVVRAARCVADAAGACGMVGGQVIDMESEGHQVEGYILERMHRLKTGALIRASVMAPAILCGTGQAAADALSSYADNLGLAFQIRDDLLDVQGITAELGKPTGSDAKKGKSTYVTLLGTDKALMALAKARHDALDALSMFGEQACFLREMAAFVADRTS
jgi:geranylgeranyl diphosphate synthase type II